MRYPEKYVFYDTQTGFEEYNIEGRAYTDLIETCCKYSTVMALRFYPREGGKIIDALENFRITKPDNIEFQTYDSSVDGRKAEIIYYKITPNVKDILSCVTDNIWGWVSYDNTWCMEDPTFFRIDGSIFFSSATHDGECALFPRDGEDISLIINSGRWIKSNISDGSLD